MLKLDSFIDRLINMTAAAFVEPIRIGAAQALVSSLNTRRSIATHLRIANGQLSADRFGADVCAIACRLQIGVTFGTMETDVVDAS